MANACMICEGVAEAGRRGATSYNMPFDAIVTEGFLLGVIAERALSSRGIALSVQNFLCTTHIAYLRKCVGEAAKAHPELAPFMNFGLTVVK